jgi:uncharacterized membrane protein
LRWFVAIPISILGGCFTFVAGMIDDDGRRRTPAQEAAYVRGMVEVGIVFGVVVAALILWFTWLRHYVRRRSANRALRSGG